METSVYVAPGNQKYLIEYIQIFEIYYNAKIIQLQPYNIKEEELDKQTSKNIIFISLVPSGILNNLEQILPKYNIFVINVDQFSVRRLDYFLNIMTKGIRVIDYSEQNISFTKNPKHFCVPLFYNNKIIVDGNYEKIYDIGFTGYMTDRRRNIINALKNMYKVIVIDLFGRDRDIILKQCKIVLNIHAFDNKDATTEVMRCYPLLYNKILVISENTILNETNSYNRSINNLIIFTDYNKIIKKCHSVLDNYDKNYGQIFGNYSNQYLTSLSWTFARQIRLKYFSDIFVDLKPIENNVENDNNNENKNNNKKFKYNVKLKNRFSKINQHEKNIKLIQSEVSSLKNKIKKLEKKIE
ncbi:hypothetical protein QKC54_gp0517 [Megavirus baoshan]|uniref:Uncharacterized protein n=1 Tax=Megavirus baoshan TaxID=2496520 RepID=A0A3Q8U7W9_9VIRU|nr:hypothetical protein QKC54_gp0517 [Megavirus baoshan]AZL89313.1 hypothetical protein Mb0555 [Megavirus baoshan]